MLRFRHGEGMTWIRILVQGTLRREISPAGMGENAWPDCWRNLRSAFILESIWAVIQAGVAARNRTSYHRTSTVNKDSGRLDMHNEVLDVTGSAVLRGVDTGVKHSFKLFVRGIMAELYVDGLLVQSFRCWIGLPAEWALSSATPSACGKSWRFTAGRKTISAYRKRGEFNDSRLSGKKQKF